MDSTANSTLVELNPASPGAVSPQALALYRLIERLSRKTGYACVKLLETLAAMHGRSVRAVRYALKELIASGWLRRQQTRKGGTSKLFFWPLVRIAGRSRGLFSAPRVAGNFAGCSGEELQFTPSAPSKKNSRREENDEPRRQGAVEDPKPAAAAISRGAIASARPVVVSGVKSIPPSLAALPVGEGFTRKVLSTWPVAVVESAAAAVRAYLGKKPGNAEALLVTALRESWKPPVSDYAPVHSSDRRERPIRVVTAPQGFALGKPSGEKPSPASQNGESGQEGGRGAWEVMRAKLKRT